MNTCKWCNASGWFHALTENGLCKECNLLVVNRVQIHARIMRRTLRDLQETSALDTKMRLSRRIQEEARALRPFEDKEIATIDPSPKELIDIYSSYHNRLRTLRHNRRNLTSTAPNIEEPEITSIEISESMDPLGTWPDPAAA